MTVAVQQDAHQRATAAQLSHIAIHDKSMHRLFDISLEFWDRPHVTEVIDTRGNVKQQVTRRQNSQILQQFRALRSHSAHELNGSLQPFRWRLLPHVEVGRLSIRHGRWSRPFASRGLLSEKMEVS